MAFHIGFHKTRHLNAEPRGETRGQVLSSHGHQVTGHQRPSDALPEAAGATDPSPADSRQPLNLDNGAQLSTGSPELLGTQKNPEVKSNCLLSGTQKVRAAGCCLLFPSKEHVNPGGAYTIPQGAGKLQQKAHFSAD